MSKTIGKDALSTMSAFIYPVNEVERGYKYYLNLLVEKCYGMFEYENLPQSLPAEQIEKRLILSGFCGVFNHSVHGIVTSWGGLSGVDIYNKPTEFTYAQAVLGSSVLKIDDRCSIIYNSSQDINRPLGLRQLIQRYSRLLADIDSSINICTVNTRSTFLTVAKNQTVAASILDTMGKIQKGEFATVNENSVLNAFNTQTYRDGNNHDIEQLLKARHTMLSNFLEEIGVRSASEKRERLVVDEVSANNQLLLVNQEDMLRQRQLGVERINELFGTNIKVRKSKTYDVESIDSGAKEVDNGNNED